MLSVGKTGTSTTQAQTLRQVSQQLASDLGIKDTSVAQSAIELSLGVGAGSVNEKLSALLPLKLGASGVQRTSNQIDIATRKAASALQSAGISNVDQVVDSYVKSDEFRQLQNTNRESAQRIDSSFQRARTYRESASADLRSAQEHRELAQKAQTLSRNLNFNNVVEWNRYLRDIGLEGESDKTTLAAAVPGFLRTGTFVSGRNEEVWFKPYDGQGPSSVALPSNAYGRQTPSNRSDPDLDRNQDLLMLDRSANDDRVRAAAPRRPLGAAREVAVQAKVDSGVAQIETAVGAAGRQATAGSNTLGRELNEAAENVPITQNLGDQSDGRSAKQRLDRKPPEKTGGATGEW